ncbi:unnamed protein product [Prorocentrum cordatum]|uniref:Uncharacterized protein n=1 Tax=Prorocentrum cordatum TaxID=2364126 RepID=A0ABN9SAC6_9DINO|nr:unnamed protein product [Polarella glacialis]
MMLSVPVLVLSLAVVCLSGEDQTRHIGDQLDEQAESSANMRDMLRHIFKFAGAAADNISADKLDSSRYVSQNSLMFMAIGESVTSLRCDIFSPPFAAPGRSGLERENTTQQRCVVKLGPARMFNVHVFNAFSHALGLAVSRDSSPLGALRPPDAVAGADLERWLGPASAAPTLRAGSGRLGIGRYGKTPKTVSMVAGEMMVILADAVLIGALHRLYEWPSCCLQSTAMSSRVLAMVRAPMSLPRWLKSSARLLGIVFLSRGSCAFRMTDRLLTTNEMVSWSVGNYAGSANSCTMAGAMTFVSDREIHAEDHKHPGLPADAATASDMFEIGAGVEVQPGEPAEAQSGPLSLKRATFECLRDVLQDEREHELMRASTEIRMASFGCCRDRGGVVGASKAQSAAEARQRRASALSRSESAWTRSSASAAWTPRARGSRRGAASPAPRAARAAHRTCGGSPRRPRRQPRAALRQPVLRLLRAGPGRGADPGWPALLRAQGGHGLPVPPARGREEERGEEQAGACGQPRLHGRGPRPRGSGLAGRPGPTSAGRPGCPRRRRRARRIEKEEAASWPAAKSTHQRADAMRENLLSNRRDLEWTRSSLDELLVFAGRKEGQVFDPVGFAKRSGLPPFALPPGGETSTPLRLDAMFSTLKGNESRLREHRELLDEVRATSERREGRQGSRRAASAGEVAALGQPRGSPLGSPGSTASGASWRAVGSLSSRLDAVADAARSNAMESCAPSAAPSARRGTRCGAAGPPRGAGPRPWSGSSAPGGCAPRGAPGRTAARRDQDSGGGHDAERLEELRESVVPAPGSAPGAGGEGGGRGGGRGRQGRPQMGGLDGPADVALGGVRREGVGAVYPRRACGFLSGVASGGVDAVCPWRACTSDFLTGSRRWAAHRFARARQLRCGPASTRTFL